MCVYTHIYSLDLPDQFYGLPLKRESYLPCISKPFQTLITGTRLVELPPTFLLFLGSLMAMAAGRCDLYSLLPVTLFQAVPNISEGEGSSLQHTVEILMPQTELSNCEDRHYY